jgi:outer membrane protein assembly factor BamB
MKRWDGRIVLLSVLMAAVALSAPAVTAGAAAHAVAQASPPTYAWPEAHGGPSLDGTSTDPAISTHSAPSLGVRWMKYLGGTPYSSPVVAWNPETLVYQATDNGYLSAYTASNGQPLWSDNVGTVHSTPLAEGSYLWVAPQNGGRIYKLDAATGATVCSAPDSALSRETVGASPVLATPPGGQPTIYIGSDDYQSANGPITAINEADCTVDWQVANEPTAGSGGTWDFLSYGLTSSGKGIVLYGSADPDSSIYADDALTGDLVWRYTPPAPDGDYDVGAGVAVSAPGNNGLADGVAYVETKYGILSAIDLSTGTLIWSYLLGTQVGTDGVAIATPALSGTDLVVGTHTNGIFDFNAITGKVRWHYADTAGMDASPAIVGPTGRRVVVFGDFAGTFNVLSLRNGTPSYQYQTGGYFVASAAETDGNLIEASGNGFLYDFEPGGSNAAAPETSVTSPGNFASVTNPDGNLAVSGSASAATAISAVNVAIKSSTGTWWDGATGKWGAAPYPNAAALSDPGGTTTTWTASFPVPAGGGTYKAFTSAVTEEVADVSAGLSAPTPARSTFNVDPSSDEPTLTVASQWVAPGGQMGVSGSGFADGEPVAISFEGVNLATIDATSNGSLPVTQVTLSTSALFGPGQLNASGRTSHRSSTAPVYVTNSWTQFGGSSTQIANDPNDQVFQGDVGVSPNTFLSTAWSFTATAPVDGSVDVVDGVAYFADQTGAVYAVTLATGMTSWIHQIFNDPTVTSTPAITPGGLVIVATASGDVIALNIATGAAVWTATLSGALASPTYAGGTIYVGSSNGTVTALAASSGATTWSTTLGGAISSSPAVDTTNGVVVTGDATGTVTALDATTGTIAWTYGTSGAVSASPIIYDGRAFAASTNGSLYALAETTGDLDWSFATGSAITASPAIVQAHLVLGSSNSTLYDLLPSNGSILFQLSEPSGVVGVAGAGDFIAATTGNGTIEGSKQASGNPVAWLATQGSSLTTAPTVVNGEVFVTGQNDVVAAYAVQGTPLY